MALLQDAHPSILPSLPMNTCGGQSSCCTLNYATLPLVLCGNRGMGCGIALQIVSCVTGEPRAPLLTAKRCHPRLTISQHYIKCVHSRSSGLCNCSYPHTTDRLQTSRGEEPIVENHLPSLRLWISKNK